MKTVNAPVNPTTIMCLAGNALLPSSINADVIWTAMVDAWVTESTPLIPLIKDNSWIPWDGSMTKRGELPQSLRNRPDTKVCIQLRDGSVSDTSNPVTMFEWSSSDDPVDIVAYKIVELGEVVNSLQLFPADLSVPPTPPLFKPADIQQTPDPGAHYRYSYTVKLTPEQIEQGEVTIKLDPYRVCQIYDTGGGPREHIAKKALRGTTKGHTERELIAELRSCLDRWEEMLDEDGVS